MDKWACIGGAWFVLKGLELHVDGRGEEPKRGGVLRHCEGSIRGGWLPIRLQGSRHQLACQGAACMGICGRTGLGKVKHMANQMLWLQDVERRVSEET